MRVHTHTHTHTRYSKSKAPPISTSELRWRRFECRLTTRRQSSGWAELDELRPGTGDKGIQQCVIAWLRWRLLEANRCFSDFVCDTSIFTLSVPSLRVLLQSVHCASDSVSSTAFNQLKSGCSSQHLLNIHFHIVVADSVFPELVKCAAINSDRAVGKVPLTFLHIPERSTTHWADCESHQHISPKQKKKKKKATTEAVNECTYLRPD